jgi:hypothetical protein
VLFGGRAREIYRQRDTDATGFDEQFLNFTSAGAASTCEIIITMPPVFWAVVGEERRATPLRGPGEKDEGRPAGATALHLRPLRRTVTFPQPMQAPAQVGSAGTWISTVSKNLAPRKWGLLLCGSAGSRLYAILGDYRMTNQTGLLRRIY